MDTAIITASKVTRKSIHKDAYLQPVLCPWCQGAKCPCCAHKGYVYRQVDNAGKAA